MADLDLETRAGLPDHLRVLVREIPRETWEAHEGFGMLTRFWLERHLAFREILSHLGRDTGAYLAGAMPDETFGPRLHRLASIFVGQLHEHHHVEDAHYFPRLARMDGRLERGFEILDHDHTALDGHLHDFTNDTNAVLQGLNTRDVGDTVKVFHERLQGFDRFLDRHLHDEEEIIVPVLLKYGEDRV